ncbi:hypothetical protein GQ457_03G035150 [Hibiscus cannabinus]
MAAHYSVERAWCSRRIRHRPEPAGARKIAAPPNGLGVHRRERCFVWISSVASMKKDLRFGRFWIYAGLKVQSFNGKKVCLSSMKKDLPWINSISCLKYGSWMIRPAPMIEAGACLLLELSPRSCIKLKIYSLRSVFNFLFSDGCFVFVRSGQSQFHFDSSVVAVLEQ